MRAAITLSGQDDFCQCQIKANSRNPIPLPPFITDRAVLSSRTRPLPLLERPGLMLGQFLVSKVTGHLLCYDHYQLNVSGLFFFFPFNLLSFPRVIGVRWSCLRQCNNRVDPRHPLRRSAWYSRYKSQYSTIVPELQDDK